MPMGPRVHTLNLLQRDPFPIPSPQARHEERCGGRLARLNGRRIVCRTPKLAKVRASLERFGEPIQADLGRPVLRRKIFRLARRANHRYLLASRAR
jgi:hypothetical protein